MNNTIDSKIKRLLSSHILFYSGRILFDVYLNIFIWKTTNDLSLVALFNFLFFFSHSISFTIFSSLVKKGRMQFPRKLSLVFFILIYFIVGILGEQTMDYLIPLGICLGLINGLYWISYQILRFDFTNKENRGNFTGLERGGRIAAGIVMPFFGGLVITMNYFGLGYSNIFFLGTFLFLAALLIGNIKYPTVSTSSLHLRKTFKELKRNPDIMKVMWSFFASGMGRVSSIEKVLVPLLIFSVVQKELILGTWISFFYFLAIFVSIILGKFLHYKYYRKSIAFGGSMILASLVLLILYPSYLVYIIFGINLRIFALFVLIPKRVISENLIHTLKDYVNHRVEYIVIRDLFNNGFSKTLSYVILFFAAGLAPSQLNFVLIIIGGAVLLEIILLLSVKFDVTKT